MKRVTLLLGAALFALVACEDKKPETKPEDPSVKNATTTTTANASAATTAAAPVSINDSDLATPADFEESAEKAIDKKNYKAELATLETDISKE